MWVLYLIFALIIGLPLVLFVNIGLLFCIFFKTKGIKWINKYFIFVSGFIISVMCIVSIKWIQATKSEGVELSVEASYTDDLAVKSKVINNTGSDIYNIELIVQANDMGYNTVVEHEDVLGVGDVLRADTVLRPIEDSGMKSITVNEFSMVERVCFLLVYLLIACALVYVGFKFKYKVLIVFCLCGINLLYSYVYLNQCKINRNDFVVKRVEQEVSVVENGSVKDFIVFVTYTKIKDSEHRIDWKKDTDGDGLLDVYEEYMFGTNIYQIDTFGEGIGDANNDADKDGITDIEEIRLGSNPSNVDTDYDGLDDNIEKLLGTSLVLRDTDGDGLTDNLEVEQGYDPLISEEEFQITKEVEYKDIKVQVCITGSGKQCDSLEINKYKSYLINENVPGYIASAFEFKNEDGFKEAEISFELDKNWFSGKHAPCIYYFNEDTQWLEELPCEIKGNSISTTVEHFSVYMVLDKLEVDRWRTNDVVLKDTDKASRVSFVVDNSQSMEINDENNTTHEVINLFVDSLSKDLDKVNLVTFTQKGNIACEFTEDFELFKGKVNNMKWDTGDNEDSGTNIYGGLMISLDNFEANTTNDYIILVTDGESTYSDYTWKDVLKIAKEKEISIYCLHIDNKNNDITKRELKSICEGSGGKYFKVEDFVAEMNRVENFISGVYQDSNNDGLSDYYTDLICDRLLYTGTGLDIRDVDLELLKQDNSDIDGDGLLNGEEYEIAVFNGHVYLKINSSPFSNDTDKDGILDDDDTAPLCYGLEGGVVGEIYIAAHNALHKQISNGDRLNLVGHSWIVYHSYVDMTLNNYTNISQGYIPIRVNKVPAYISWHNLFPYEIKAGDYVSFGYADIGNANGEKRWEDNITEDKLLDYLQADKSDVLEPGLLLNGEYRWIRQERYGLYNNSVALSRIVNYNEVLDFLNYSNIKRDYNVFLYNCTDYALGVWNKSAKDEDYIEYRIKLSIPDVLVGIIKKKDDCITSFAGDMLIHYGLTKPKYEFIVRAGEWSIDVDCVVFIQDKRRRYAEYSVESNIFYVYNRSRTEVYR